MSSNFFSQTAEFAEAEREKQAAILECFDRTPKKRICHMTYLKMIYRGVAL